MEKKNENQACINTDKEIYRESDYYSNSLFITNQGELGINVGGYVIIKTIEDWHKLGDKN